MSVSAPSFVEYAVRNGASGVLVATCRAGGCEFRLGQRWTEERMARQRDPHLRVQAPTHRMQLVFADPGEEYLLDKALLGLRERVRAMSPHARMNSDENCY